MLSRVATCRVKINTNVRICISFELFIEMAGDWGAAVEADNLFMTPAFRAVFS